ncbi:hypothetical protein ACIOWE_16405 [Pseudomonas sp. NPDC087598]|uniref:hypothetical protein n=1 Tax=Pseudomonas sp. NPDC087598 TaxID=3364440 RepID=UPI0037FE33E9
MSYIIANPRKKLVPPSQLQWQHTDEPALLDWTIRARNYNTLIANVLFWSCLTAITIGSLLIYKTMDDTPIFSGILTLLFFITVNIALVSMTHQKMNFSYRFTLSGIECCEWKDLPEWTLTFLKWFTGISVVSFIVLATIDPAFLIGALIGPGGMGLMYLSMANSKSYREMHTQYHHLIYEWKDFTQLAIATNREVVDLKFTHFNPRLGKVISYSINIFCMPKQKEGVANFIKPLLSPDVPFIRAKVNVPMSTV